MSDDLRARIDALFDRALDLPPDERAAFIARESTGEPVLAREVLALVRFATEPDLGVDDWANASAALWADLANELQHDITPATTATSRRLARRRLAPAR